VTIVDLWGTWCPFSRQEVPQFVDLHQKYHDRGLQVVGVFYQRGSEETVRETIKAFAAKNKLPYPCLVGDARTQDQIPDFAGYPTALFLDRTGTVRARVEGFDPGLAADFDALVTMLLAEKSAAAVSSR
jgi:thiol-disulfide isomerase/thioredoxin